ncbi:MAG: anion permease [Bacillota bacterium]|nr:MAG: anion permease [Bacillota bacterium]
MSPLAYVIVIAVLAWTYDFYNGMNDAANAIATTVSTRALRPGQAIALARTFNVIGAFATTAVAQTIGKGIVDPAMVDRGVWIAALVGAILWSAVCTHQGIPISITHSLVGGIVGAAWVGYGFGIVKWAGLTKVFWGLLLSPLVGFAGAYLVMIAVLWLFRRVPPSKANRFFRFGQIASASFMAFAHGSNDTQNAMGMITAALVAAGFLNTFKVPWWVIIGSAVFMGLGTSIGGWKVIRTLGMRVAKIEPPEGFSAETAAASSIIGATLLGAPISTTHVISTAVMGVGATRRLSAVRWGVARDIVLTWLLTFPGAAIGGAVTYFVVVRLLSIF